MKILEKKLNNSSFNIIFFPPAATLASSIREIVNSIIKSNIFIFDYPGRGVSISEEKIKSFDSLIKQILADIQPLIKQEFILSGHSFGANVVLRLARMLQIWQKVTPKAIIISGIQKPNLFNPQKLLSNFIEDPEGLLFTLGLDSNIDKNFKLLLREWFMQDLLLLSQYRYEPFHYNTKLFVLNGIYDTFCFQPNDLQYWKNLAEEVYYFELECGHSYNTTIAVHTENILRTL